STNGITYFSRCRKVPEKGGIGEEWGARSSPATFVGAAWRDESLHEILIAPDSVLEESADDVRLRSCPQTARSAADRLQDWSSRRRLHRARHSTGRLSQCRLPRCRYRLTLG